MTPARLFWLLCLLGCMPSALAKQQTLKPEWVLLPIPNYQPDQGWGGVLSLQYIDPNFYPTEAGVTPRPDMYFVWGSGTQEGSFSLGAGGKWHLSQDTWRLGIVSRYQRQQSDSLGENDQGDAIYGEKRTALLKMGGLYSILPNWFAGLGIGLKTTDFTQADGYEANTSDHNVGAMLLYDWKDDPFSPTTGLTFRNRYRVFSEAFGNDFNYEQLAVQYKQYLRLSSKQTLAWHLDHQASYGNVPPYALNSPAKKLRGYKQGAEKGLYAFSGELEYRYTWNKHWGAVAFTGLGSSENHYPDFTSTSWLPAVGGGVRHRFAKYWKIDLRLDVAWGKNGVFAYVGAGQAF